MRVLIVTSEWPTQSHPIAAPYMIQQVNFLRKAGIDVKVFPFHGEKSIINYIQGWYRLHRLLSVKDIHLIHAHWGQNAIISVPSKIPLVITFHGSDLQGIQDDDGKQTIYGKFLRRFSKIGAKYASEIIVVSDHLTKFLPGGKRAYVIPGGVDLNLFHPIHQSDARDQLGLHHDKKYILFAANPKRDVKRYSLAALAVEQIKNYFNLELITIANVPHQQVPIFMNAADVLLVTSRQEGSPTVVKEALACNMPIVSTDVGDVKQRLSTILGCVVCENDNPETIAAGLSIVLSQEKRINGFDHVKCLDESLVVEQIIQVYNKALSIHHKN